MVLPLELDSEMLNLLQRLERLTDRQLENRESVGIALGRVLTRALAAMVRQEARKA